MAKIIPVSYIVAITGTLSPNEKIYSRTNKRTGQTFTSKLTRPTYRNTEAQHKLRASLGARSRAASEWNRANRPSAEHPDGTPLYQALRAAYERQNKIGNFFAFIVKCTTENGEVVV